MWLVVVRLVYYERFWRFYPSPHKYFIPPIYKSLFELFDKQSFCIYPQIRLRFCVRKQLYFYSVVLRFAGIYLK